MNQVKGKIIAFEGIDGSGKATQLELLKSYLGEKGSSYACFNFPRHNTPVFGEIIDQYLKGSFGDPVKLNPYLSSLLFSADRWETGEEIIRALAENEFVLIDRYVNSNYAHQAVKLKEEEREGFIEWLENLEYTKMGLPRPDKVIYLKVPLRAVNNMLKERSKGEISDQDLHEQNLDYQRRVKEIYESIAKTRKEWQIIDCGKGADGILAKEKIFEKILASLKEFF